MTGDELRRYLQSLVGRKIEGEDICYLFVRDIYRLVGIELSPDIYAEEKNFEIVEKPALLDIAVLRHALLKRRHVGIMLDSRWMIHCSDATNGVGKSDLTRVPYCYMTKRFGRHKSLCLSE